MRACQARDRPSADAERCMISVLSRYLDGLLGPWPAAEKVYKERSPIEALDKFDKPIAFFQVSSPPQIDRSC